ncbi:MAG: hypothetical protein HYY24_12185 [Verrucomicrobia bacterium]|nr:hypothetical protein [Verrucomicrobiota bacterium]
MHLFDAILEANRRFTSGDKAALITREQFTNSLPVAALTCIDVRLNPLLPHALGLAEEDFIWLRNAGNIIFDPMSSMMRTLALACAIKGGKEIAIIGHTDCRVRATSIVELTDRFRALGVERSRLPENLNDFFGLFASERQNVLRGAEVVRQSPLIGPKVPVHGLLMDIETGALEWLVNGYQSFATTGSELKLEAKIGGKEIFETKLELPAFHLGEMKLPEIKIGDFALQIGTQPVAEQSTTSAPKPPEVHFTADVPKPIAELARVINKALKYKIIGSDQKQYGPVSGAKLLEWLADERIDAKTPIQVEGSTVWQTLAALTEAAQKLRHIPLPPSIEPRPFGQKPKRH